MSLKNIRKSKLKDVKEKADKLIFDALYNSHMHIEQYDIDWCFAGETPEYFEANTIAEIVDYVKDKERKIKALFLFFSITDTTPISEFMEVYYTIKQYCTADCIKRKIMSATGVVHNTAKYRMLLCFTS